MNLYQLVVICKGKVSKSYVTRCVPLHMFMPVNATALLPKHLKEISLSVTVCHHAVTFAMQLGKYYISVICCLLGKSPASM